MDSAPVTVLHTTVQAGDILIRVGDWIMDGAILIPTGVLIMDGAIPTMDGITRGTAPAAIATDTTTGIMEDIIPTITPIPTMVPGEPFTGPTAAAAP